MEYSKNISYDRVKEYIKKVNMTDRSKKLIEYACKGNVDDFAKILEKYVWMGTRDTTMVMMVASFIVLGKQAGGKLSENYVTYMLVSDLSNIFYNLGLGVGSKAVTCVLRCTHFRKLFDEVLSRAIPDGDDDKALKKRADKWGSFISQLGKVKPWKLSASKVSQCVKPVLDELLPPILCESFERGFTKRTFVEPRPQLKSKDTMDIYSKKSKANEALKESLQARRNVLEEGDRVGEKILKKSPAIGVYPQIEKNLLGKPSMLTGDEMELVRLCLPKYGNKIDEAVAEFTKIINVLRIGKFYSLYNFNMKSFITKGCKMLPLSNVWVDYLGNLLKKLCDSQEGRTRCAGTIRSIGESDYRNVANMLNDYVREEPVEAEEDDIDYDGLDDMLGIDIDDRSFVSELYPVLKKVKFSDFDNDEKKARALKGFKLDKTRQGMLNDAVKCSAALSKDADIKKLMKEHGIEPSVVLCIDLCEGLKGMKPEERELVRVKIKTALRGVFGFSGLLTNVIMEKYKDDFTVKDTTWQVVSDNIKDAANWVGKGAMGIISVPWHWLVGKCVGAYLTTKAGEAYLKHGGTIDRITEVVKEKGPEYVGDLCKRLPSSEVRKLCDQLPPEAFSALDSYLGGELSKILREP